MLFRSNKRCLAFFFFSHLYVFFGEMSVQFFGPFFAWVVYFSGIELHVAAAAKSLQSYSTLCDPIDGSPPVSSVPGILHVRILEWVAISFSSACMHAKSLQSCLIVSNPIDSNPPDSSVHGILHVRKLEWVAVSSSRGSSRPRDRTRCSGVSCKECLLNE